MLKKISKNDERLRRHARVRNKISGTAECPRLNVFRSNAHIHAQIIDDTTGTTLVACSSVDMKLANGGNVEAAKTVGAELANRAQAKNIKKVVFDRGGYVYHGRVQALADAAKQTQKDFGVFASVTLAQAALESAWGKSNVANENRNLFGIKYTGMHL